MVHVRLSPVLSARGGMLKTILPAFKLGVGGRIGSGTQWFPWISERDAAAVFVRAIDDDALEGPVNAVGPTPARNAEFVRVLARTLHRPALVPAPIPVMKLALGSEVIDEMLLASQKVIPARLEAVDFDFLDRTIEAALRHELSQ